MLAGMTGATVPVAQAYVADVTGEKQRLKYLGWTSAAGGLAFIVGPAIGGVLSGFLGYVIPSFVAATLAFANFVSGFFFLPEPKRSNLEREKSAFTLKALKDSLSKRGVVLVLAVYFMFFISFIFFQASVSPWLEQLFGFGSLQTSILFTYVGSTSVLTQALILPRLSKKHLLRC
jgi:DHA1 family tetracycline resistance protein-like MFS transporter